MGNNLEILNEWNKTLSSYRTFKFVEARELYQKIVNIADSNLKRQYMQELIMGTLYVVSNFIKSNGLLYLNSISYDMKKVDDENMKENLSTQFSEYGKIVDKVNTQFEHYGEVPDETPITDKMMGWTGIQLNTITDKSNSHIAEMMIQGGDMGIIECKKLLNHNPYADQEVKNILNDFMNMQKNDIEQMKKFL